MREFLKMRNHCLLLAMLCFELFARAQPSQPLWEIDLSKYGYQGRPPVSLGPFGFWAYQQGVAFTDPNVVVVFFVVRDDPPGAPAEQRAPSVSDPFRLLAIFLNTEDGGLIKKLDWPLPSNPQAVAQSFFLPASKGRFIIGLGNSLNLYSSDYKILARFEAPSELDVIASPSGESILLQTRDELDTARYDLLDTEKLSVLKSWKDRPQMNKALWDDELAWTSPSSLYFRASASPPKELLANKGELCGKWDFINKGELAGPVCGGAEKLLVVSTEGKVVREFDLGLERVDGPVAASRNGQRFAVPTYRWGSGRNKDPEQLTARVFSLKSEPPLVTLNVPRDYGSGQNFQTPLGDTRFGWGGLALSPDGGLLAVKSGAKVQMYRLPESGGASQCANHCGKESDLATSRPLSSELVPSLAPPVPGPSSQLIEEMLSWLPADTESVMAASGPFVMPERREDSNGAQVSESSEHEVQDTFRELSLALFGVKKGLLDKYLKDEQIVEAIEGSRDFRAPSGLGEARFQGCAIAFFARDISARANSFLKDSSQAILRTEQLEGHEVAVFEEKLEEDTWTTYVAFPRPNTS